MIKKIKNGILGMIILSGLVAVPVMAASENPQISNQKGTITIHSFEVNAYENLSESSGEEIDKENLPANANLLKDITFSIQRVDDTLGQDVTINSAIDTSFTEQKGTTGDQGKLVFSNLPKGYYLVIQQPPNGYTMQKSKFIVKLPMQNKNDAGEVMDNYDVHVYPKNAMGPVITKKPLGVPVVGVGDEVIWEIAYPIDGELKKETNKGTVYVTDFYLTDSLDKRLDYVEGSAEFTVYDKNGVQMKLTMDKGSDYHEKYDAERRFITWKYTAQGVKKMADHNVASSTVRIITKVNETAYGTVNAVWNNAALNFTNTSGDPYRTEVFAEGSDINGETVPKVYLGSITIDKYEHNQTAVKLADVTFKVAQSEADAKNGRYIQVDGNDYQVTTDHAGYARFTALKAGEYWLVETQTAAGYQLLNGAVKVTIGETNTSANAIISIANEKIRSEGDAGGSGGSGGAGFIRPPSGSGGKPTGGTSGKGSGAKTGDMNNTLHWIGLAVLALLIAIILWKQRQEDKERRKEL